jgi:hypothetical protein
MLGGEAVAVRHGGGHPGGGHEAGGRQEGSDHTAASAIGDEGTIRVDPVLHGAAVAGDDEASALEELFG